MFRYIRANIVGTVYSTALNVDDVQKQPDLLERAYNLGKRLVGAR